MESISILFIIRFWDVLLEFWKDRPIHDGSIKLFKNKVVSWNHLGKGWAGIGLIGFSNLRVFCSFQSTKRKVSWILIEIMPNKMDHNIHIIFQKWKREKIGCIIRRFQVLKPEVNVWEIDYQLHLMWWILFD